MVKKYVAEILVEVGVIVPKKKRKEKRNDC